MICSRCGKNNSDEARFCSGCGNELKTVYMENTVQNNLNVEYEQNSTVHNIENIQDTKSVETTTVQMKKRKPVFLWIGIAAAVITAAVILTVFISTRSSDKDKYKDKMDLGRKYLLEMDYDQAILCFKEAIKIDPKNKEAYLELADAYVKNGEPEKAIDILETALDEVENKKDKEKIEEKKEEIEEEELSTTPTPEVTEAPTSEVTSTPEPTVTETPTVTPEFTDTPIPTVTTTPEPTGSPYLNANTGDIITFGSYEQDNDLSNGKEPIEWIVLSNEGDRLLLLSKYALDCQPYYEELTYITWEDCYIRNWLNTEFLKNAFNDVEKSDIINSYILNPDNPKYGTDSENDTYDYVFLLSMNDMLETKYGFSKEIYEYDTARRCAPTDYAVAQGAYQTKLDISEFSEFYTYEGKGACSWWLRSPGYSTAYASCVHGTGGMDKLGNYVNNATIGVRPALYLNISSSETAPVSEETELEAAFKAYLEIIKKKKDKLDIPYANWDKSVPEVPRQTIAVLDVWGNEIPELILAESEHIEDTYNLLEPLSIYTYENGKARKIFERNVDLEGGVDFVYYDLMLTNTNELYLYEVSGCDCGYGTWSRLFSNGENTEKIEMIKADGYEAGNPEDTFYNSYGDEINSYEFYRWKTQFDNSVTCSIFSTAYDNYGDPIAMNYREAVDFFENWKETGFTNGIEWFEEKYYPLSIYRIMNEVKKYDYNLIYGEMFNFKDYPNQVYDTGLDMDLMTRITVFSTDKCRGECIGSDTHYYDTEYPEDYYRINSEELEKEGMNLFGKSLNTSYLTSQRYYDRDVYNDSIYGPVYSAASWENYDDLYGNNVSIRKTGGEYIVTRKVSGYFGIYYDYAYAELIYTMEKSNKSDYGCIITSLKIKYLGTDY